MYIPKRYGQSKIDACPFCEKQATIKNRQGVPVCISHKEQAIPDIKCACGRTLEMAEGKFGPYFRCQSCGNLNLKKGLELLKDADKTSKIRKSEYVSDEGKYPGFDYGLD